MLLGAGRRSPQDGSCCWAQSLLWDKTSSVLSCLRCGLCNHMPGGSSPTQAPQLRFTSRGRALAWHPSCHSSALCTTALDIPDVTPAWNPSSSPWPWVSRILGLSLGHLERSIVARDPVRWAASSPHLGPMPLPPSALCSWHQNWSPEPAAQVAPASCMEEWRGASWTGLCGTGSPLPGLSSP